MAWLASGAPDGPRKPRSPPRSGSPGARPVLGHRLLRPEGAETGLWSKAEPGSARLHVAGPPGLARLPPSMGRASPLCPAALCPRRGAQGRGERAWSAGARLLRGHAHWLGDRGGPRPGRDPGSPSPPASSWAGFRVRHHVSRKRRGVPGATAAQDSGFGRLSCPLSRVK